MIPRPTRLVGVASVLVDVWMALDALPPRGGDALARETGHAPGGGVNALVAAARLGLAAAYGGPHGTGPRGDAVRAALTADGVRALLPPDPRGDTGWCLALVEPDGERTFVTVPGVEAGQRAGDLAGLALGPNDAVYASGYDLAYPGSGPVLGPWLAGLPGPRRDAGPWLVLDPGPLAAAIPGQRLAAVLARTDLLTLSAAEVPLVGGHGELRALAARGVLVVERQGARGAVLRGAAPADDVAVPALPPPGPVIDTNGAGDAHLGGLLAALSAGADPAAAARVAAAAAAYCLTRPGAATGPGAGELRAAYPALELRLPARVRP